MKSSKLTSKVVVLYLLMLLAVILCNCNQVHAEQNGDFTYEIKNGEATVTKYIGSSVDVTIPDTLGGANVVSIGDYAFFKSNINNITFPEGLRTIGMGSFSFCENLKNFNFPVSLTYIGYFAFASCESVDKIEFPENLNTIESAAFDNCKNVTNVYIPVSVEYIGYGLFRGCEKLESITVDINNLNYLSMDGVLYDKSKTMLIACPNNIILPQGVTKFEIPNSVNRIGDYAFAGNVQFSLNSVTIPDSVTVIGNGAFREFRYLRSIEIPGSVTDIGQRAFTSCTMMTTALINYGVKNIGENAFDSCTGLEELTLPKSIESVGISAFDFCNSLKTIQFDSATSVIEDNKWGMSFDTIPKTTTIIGYEPSTAKDYAIAHGNTFKSLNTSSTSEERDINEKFNYNPNEYSQTLAERAAVLSMLAYDDYVCNVVTKTNYRASASRNIDPVFLTCELISQKFEDIKPCNYRDANNNPDNNPDNVSFSLAHKKVFYNNQMTNLTVVVIRGTNGIEWQGNMDITGDTYDGSLMNHWSFDKAKVDVMNQLKQYLTDHQIDNTILLVTGHSRGAGVANLVSNDLTNDNPNDGIGDVFAYTFATPNVTLNPDYSKTNIFNFCFEDDFVPQVPLSSWGYGKNGTTYTSIAQDAYRSNTVFKNEMDNFVKISNESHEGARFNYYATKNLINYVQWKWKKSEDFYNMPVWVTTDGQFNVSYLHDFFKNYVAPAAYNQKDLNNILKLIGIGSYYYAYMPILNFFVAGNAFNKYIGDNHQMFTYYSALKNGEFDDYSGGGGGGGGSTFSVSNNSAITVNGTTTGTPTNPNSAEVQKLKDFAAQGDNLSKLGWTLDNASTWSGVLWSDETENRVVSLDLKFKDLTGTLDLSDFIGLEVIDVSGNSMTAISLASCNALTGLNCSYNELTQLDLTSSAGIRTLNCNGNQLQTLNLSGCTVLEELDCSNNQLADLNVSANTVLTNLYCSSNNLLSLDLTANTLLTNFDCEGNYLDVQEGSEMYSRIQTILGMDGGWVSYEYQKIKENVVFNSDEVAKLSEFANQGDNLSNLQWNLGKPSEWYGIEWIMSGTEYRVNRLMLDNLDLTGSLNVSGMTALSSFSCNNNQLTSINAANCEKLGYLSCYNTGINELNISGCSALNHLECSNNYLDLSVGSQLKDNIETIRLKEGSIVSCDPQKIAASKDQFNAEEVSLLLAFAGNNGNSELLNWNADKPGEWAGVTWKKIDGEYRVTALTFNTKPVTGSLDLSNFGKLTMLDCSLTKISAMRLPSSLTAIEANTFYNCAALTDVTLPESLTVIGDEAFYNCSALKDLKLPESMATIGEGAFAGCKSLTTMEIPANTISLGNYGFYECTGLVTIQFNTSTIVIGDDPSTIPVTAIVRGNDPSTAKDYAVKYGQTFEAIASNTKLGDVDGNGEIQAYDALMALQIATGKKIGTAAEIKAADVDNSGSVQAYDALRILQYATGKIQAF